MELADLDIRGLIAIGIIAITLLIGLWMFFRTNRKDRKRLTEELNRPDLLQRKKRHRDDPEDVRQD